MKKFSNYQYVPIREANDTDRRDFGSEFWGEAKWRNFVLPFLPEDCSDLTLVDIGCNAGLFLEEAEKKGFKKVIGVDKNRRAIKIAEEYKKSIGGTYEIRYERAELCLENLPVSDYIVMAMTHYYFAIDSWFMFLDELMRKTRNVIIVTAHKREKLSKAAADTDSVRGYFRCLLLSFV